jgi:hypothetical protein
MFVIVVSCSLLKRTPKIGKRLPAKRTSEAFLAPRRCDAAAFSCASPLSRVQLTMDRSTALSLTAAWLLRQPTTTRSTIDRFTSSPLQTLHHGRPFEYSKRHRGS